MPDVNSWSIEYMNFNLNIKKIWEDYTILIVNFRNDTRHYRNAWLYILFRLYVYVYIGRGIQYILKSKFPVKKNRFEWYITQLQYLAGKLKRDKGALQI